MTEHSDQDALIPPKRVVLSGEAADPSKWFLGGSSAEDGTAYTAASDGEVIRVDNPNVGQPQAVMGSPMPMPDVARPKPGCVYHPERPQHGGTQWCLQCRKDLHARFGHMPDPEAG